jgi:hypothetical protein
MKPTPCSQAADSNWGDTLGQREQANDQVTEEVNRQEDGHTDRQLVL